MPKVTRAGALTSLSLTILLALPSSAAAIINEAAAGLRTVSSADLDGVRGTQGIRTNPGTVNEVSYVHPTQMDVGSPGASFVAVGTYNGQGTSAGGLDCPNDYDPDWNIYVDGTIASVYFCDRVAQDVYGANTSPPFRIEREVCAGPSSRWALYFGGSQRACLDSGASAASTAVAGIEVVSSGGVDRNVDVKYTSLNGGVESLASAPHNSSQFSYSAEELRLAGIEAGMVRLSIGLEDPEALIADLEQALTSA